MKVSLIGFSVKSDNEYVTLPYFFNYLHETKNSRKIKYKHCDRYFFIDDRHNPNYRLGMIITVKDQKSYLKFKEVGGAYIIKRENLHGEEKLLDCNFFVINKNNGFGIYTHYFQSCSIREMGSILRSWFYDLRDGLKKRNQKKPDQGWASKSFKYIKTKVDKKYKGRFHFSIVTRPEGLQEVLENMARIKNVEVVLDGITPSDARPGVPLADKSRRVTEKFSIGSGWSVDAVIHDIVEISDIDGLQRGKVLCVNPDGREESVKFFNSPSKFGEYEYDDFTTKIDNLDAGEFYRNEVFDELISVMEAEGNEDIFGSEVEND